MKEKAHQISNKIVLTLINLKASKNEEINGLHAQMAASWIILLFKLKLASLEIMYSFEFCLYRRTRLVRLI